MFRTVFVAMLLIQLSCSAHRYSVTVPYGYALETEHAVLNNHSLEMRLSKPEHPAADNLLVIYSTGDGGWRAIDNDIYHWISSWGYPAAGFNSSDYIKILGYSSVTSTTTPESLMRDFESIIRFAEDRLNLPAESNVLLVGNSRGAGLSVVAAGEGGLMSRLAGIVAIALTREEEHVLHYRRTERRSNPGTPARELVEIKTYEYLPRLASFPVVVIQSEKDRYLPAAEARALFGPDTALHHLRAINARSHSFKGAVPILKQELQTAMQWICQRI